MWVWLLWSCYFQLLHQFHLIILDRRNWTLSNNIVLFLGFVKKKTKTLNICLSSQLCIFFLLYTTYTQSFLQEHHESHVWEKKRLLKRNVLFIFLLLYFFNRFDFFFGQQWWVQTTKSVPAAEAHTLSGQRSKCSFLLCLLGRYRSWALVGIICWGCWLCEG